MNLRSMLCALTACLGLLASAVHAVTCAANLSPSNPDAAYVDNADGTVTHLATGLIWKRCSEGQSWNGSTCTGSVTGHTWAQALTLAAHSSFAAKTDWRLPNIRELRSLVEECRYPTINDAVFPAMPGISVWSGSPHRNDSDYTSYVNFTWGYADYAYFRDGSYGVRLVRGGQSFGSFDAMPEQTPPERTDLTEVSNSLVWPNSAARAVVITHGWNDNSTGWVQEMAEKFCGKFSAGLIVSSAQDGTLTRICQANNWDVWIVDWRKKADTGFGLFDVVPDPMQAYVNAIGLGQKLATNLKVKNYSHIHLIAHSAGSNLIDFATIWLKTWRTTEGRPPLEIHATFLDAYDPVSDSSRYGKQADWTDNYVDTREVGDLYGVGRLDGTRLFLQNGYNIDVTQLSVPDPCMQLYDVYSLPPMKPVWGCRHNRPYRFYGLSINPSFVGDGPSAAADPIPANGTGGMGYPLSVENGHSLSALNSAYPKGAKCVMDGSTCYPGSLPPSVWTYLPSALATTVVDTVTGTVNYVAGMGTTMFNSINMGAGLIAGLFNSSIQPQARMSSSVRPMAQAASTTPTELPSWIVALPTTTQPVNTLRFNWRFAAAGEGLLRVFVDSNLVRELDQRHLPLASATAEEVYIGGADGTIPAGTHRIAFRLDGFGAGASGVELTNVELGTTVQLAGSSLSLVQGWNLVGNGLDAPVAVATTFSDATRFLTVWKWMAAQNTWGFYAPSFAAQGGTVLADYAASRGYQVLGTIAGGEGYWVNAKQADSVNLPSGNAISVTSLVPTLRQGWNLVSVGEAMTPKQFCDAQGGAVTSVWAWDNAQGKWYFYAPSLDASGGLSAYIASKGYLDFTANGKTLGSGVGFWVNKP